MTVPSRGARTRRGGRGPGWILLTALLVLAILASATLVFTNRVELLRLAVILSLWAAVVAAFVTVIYRRQSEVAQARARDMKFVYDLQLDREISARREYEMSVEARLRRQLSREGVQAADEMAALRAELASLRSHLEVMLGTDLGQRPALEGERVAMPMPPPPGRVESSRVTMVAEEVITVVEESIIDVPEEPLEPEPEVALPPVEPRVREHRGAPWPSAPRPARAPYPPPPPPAPPQPEGPWRPPEARPGRHASAAAGQQRIPEVDPEPLRARHSGPSGPQSVPGRHRGQGTPAEPEPTGPPPAAESADEPAGQHSAGQSISDLLSKFNVTGPVGGGGRRRRKD